MAMTLSTFKSFGRVAILAATLGLAGATAPAFAQGQPPAGFSLGAPPNTGGQAPMADGQAPMGDGQTLAPGKGGDAMTGHYDSKSDDFYYCYDDDEIMDAIESYGFDNARVTRHFRSGQVEVQAYWGRALYSMRVDPCTGSVDRVRLLRRSGFGLQFNFGN